MAQPSDEVSGKGEPDADLNSTKAVKRQARAEHRWPAVIALAVALTLYGLLPIAITPLYLSIGIIVLATAMLIPVIVLNPHRLTRQTVWSRWLSVGQALLLAAANQYALAQLIIVLVSGGADDGEGLLVSALQVWVTNVIAFALVFWELDRGGPVARRHDERSELPPADFRFPQDEDADAIEEVAARSSARIDWTPSFIDYLYESAVSSMAFSPGAAIPLSPRVKALILLQSFTGFVLLALVIAHAVGKLGG